MMLLVCIPLLENTRHIEICAKCYFVTHNSMHKASIPHHPLLKSPSTCFSCNPRMGEPTTVLSAADRLLIKVHPDHIRKPQPLFENVRRVLRIIKMNTALDGLLLGMKVIDCFQASLTKNVGVLSPLRE